MSLVIVESPAKCSKIQGYLGDGYTVKATFGHIRALDETLDAVGINTDWTPTFKDLDSKTDAIKALKTAAKGKQVILATDDDREGEGIAWHVCHILKLNPATTPRIVFHEITKPAILAAAANPRRLDLHKVNAQQARAMLDLLVGFTISRVLWCRVAPKLSAGRCQTPALRLVVERDAEVENHRSSAFWKVHGQFHHPSLPQHLPLTAQTAQDLPTEPAAQALLQKVHSDPSVTVTAVKISLSTSQPPKPLITSTLQQEASNLHGLNPKATMLAAQKLYEAGHITYMRTDNAFIAEEAATAIRTLITQNHGSNYVGSLEPALVKKTKKEEALPAAQAAHEAIRPTHPEHQEVPVDDPTQKTVYKLIWRRAFQSLMAPATTDVKKATLTLRADPTTQYVAEQTKSNFLGWRVLENIDPAKQASEVLAWDSWSTYLVQGASLLWSTLHADECFTKPKGRFTEASLISELEKRGIGRPSTFASLVSTILDREYVEKTNVEGRTQDSKHHRITPNQWPPTTTKEAHKMGAEKNKMRSTTLGRSVSEFLTKEYNDLFNYEFTASMEQDLDLIAHGTKPWKALLQTTWDTYKERYTETISAPSDVAQSARQRQLAPGLKVILSKKGPLFVKEGATPQDKASFASLPANKTFETATLEDATAAYAAKEEAYAGELLGMYEDKEIRKKKGPFGYYVVCGDTKLNLKADMDLDAIVEALQAKADAGPAYTRIVGDFTIKRGQYGLYFFKHGLKKVTFVSLPATVDPDKLVLKDLQGMYADGLEKKRRSKLPPK
jgi:DNA topoisomerase-1